MRALFFITLGLILVRVAPASAQERVETGQFLVQEWCSGCHQVAPDLPAKDIAPPFASLANDRSKDLSWVRTRLQNPPYPMLGIDLSRDQIEAIVAYFGSLQN
jgi:mono/diheme cytochrome c family protein